jgi:hypothetical protein
MGLEGFARTTLPSLPSLFSSSTGLRRPYEEWSTEELEARLLVNDERLGQYRHLGQIAGFVGSFAIRKALR